MVLRSVVLWGGIRAVSIGLGTPPTIGFHSVLVFLLVGFLSGHDRKILGERVLLANLGISNAVLRVYTMAPVILAECALHLAVMP